MARLKCEEPICVRQREETKHAGPINKRYETHVRCKPCGTYWERLPSRKDKRQMCPCCGIQCAEGPHNTNGSERYQRRKAMGLNANSVTS